MAWTETLGQLRVMDIIYRWLSGTPDIPTGPVSYCYCYVCFFPRRSIWYIEKFLLLNQIKSNLTFPTHTNYESYIMKGFFFPDLCSTASGSHLLQYQAERLRENANQVKPMIKIQYYHRAKRCTGLTHALDTPSREYSVDIILH